MRFCLLACLIFAGCGSKETNGTVSGTITFDGQTVPDGLIRFIPADGQSQPDDCKIVNGQYSVTMPPGEKKVEITWLKTSGPQEDTATQGKTKYTQMIPSKYNTKSTLTYTIVLGPQTKNFELTTK